MNSFFNFFGGIFGYILWAIFYVVNNFGVAIIIFTLVFKIVLFPASIKQQKSMAANARLQAKQKELKEKYGNDKQKLNEETQKLYQKEGVSPFGGCLNSLFPMFIMLGIYYSVVRPLTNTLHIAADKIDALMSYVVSIPGVAIQSNSIYSQIDVVKIFGKISSNPAVTNTLSGDEINKVNSLAGGFDFLGLDLLTTPRTQGISWFLLIPILCLITSVGSQVFMMRMSGNPMQNQQGCMKYMMLFLPLITAYIAYTVPAAVGFYWICSTVLGFVQSLIMNKFYSPIQLTAKSEAQHIALLELEEKKVPYNYQPTAPQPQQNQKKNQKKK